MTRAIIATEAGDIELDLFTEGAPKAAGNFVKLAKDGFYDDVIFHRVIPGFVIQGGDGEFGKKATFNAGRVGTGGPGYKFEDEPFPGDYQRGTVAMARTPAPDSVGSQFFIVLDDRAESSLASANTYQIIGSVTSGMEVVDAIAQAAGGVEIPADPVVMTDVSVANP